MKLERKHFTIPRAIKLIALPICFALLAAALGTTCGCTKQPLTGPSDASKKFIVTVLVQPVDGATRQRQPQAQQQQLPYEEFTFVAEASEEPKRWCPIWKAKPELALFTVTVYRVGNTDKPLQQFQTRAPADTCMDIIIYKVNNTEVKTEQPPAHPETIVFGEAQ